ncbi:ATP-dependent nuclease [Gorillibacterium sp. sgz500922]|uniref:ATP-dependent nuclease n=1 Tax=Gorillibacterium sp. sgz500922 TaxID=3446694 RepID=UPI003F662AE3
MIARVQFENYRCFKNSTMSFKDLTIIVGKNNAGKSTVVEALRMISSARNKASTTLYTEPPRSLGISASTRGFKINTDKLRIDLRGVIYFYEDVTAQITAFFKDNSKIIIFINSKVAFACIYNQEGELITSQNKANLCNLSNINILPQIGLIKENEKMLTRNTIVGDKDTYLSSRHFRNEIMLYKNYFFSDFCSLSENTWPGLRIRDLVEPSTDNEYIFFSVEDAGFTSEIGLMGSGIQMWLQIIWFVCRSKDCDTIILDEPDVYMHPDLQRKLLKLIKRRFKQVIIATHSVEIISEVEPRNIIDIDKTSRKMSYAISKKGVQHIIDGLGSIHNVSLVRISNTKKCLFVEGKDIKILSKLHSKIYPDSDYSLELLPSVELGGWSRLDEAFGAAKLFHNETEDHVKCFCVIDRDYYPMVTINKQYKKAIECHLNLHIWSKKEIENYLIKPMMLFRLTGLPISKFEEFNIQLSELLDSYRVSVTDQISEQIHKLDRSKGIGKCNEEARTLILEKWTNNDEKISLIGGKELISDINVWMKENYSKSCTLARMVRNIRAEEIDEEVKSVIDMLVS